MLQGLDAGAGDVKQPLHGLGLPVDEGSALTGPVGYAVPNLPTGLKGVNYIQLETQNVERHILNRAASWVTPIGLD